MAALGILALGEAVLLIHLFPCKAQRLVLRYNVLSKAVSIYARCLSTYPLIHLSPYPLIPFILPLWSFILCFYNDLQALNKTTMNVDLDQDEDQ